MFYTKGYKDIHFSTYVGATNKGPKNYKLLYSTDGSNYTAVENSSVRTKASLKDTYSNIPLPGAADNAETLYIKIKIDGGEGVNGLELTDTLEMLGKGNTGINNIELCGTELSDAVALDTNEASVIQGKTYNVYSVCDSYDNYTVIAAQYDSLGRMAECLINPEKITILENAAKVKLMMWDSLGNMRSVIPAAVIPVTDKQ